MRRPRVLVIDDEDISGQVISSLLEGAGFDVTRLSSPIGATRVVLRERFWAVVVDLNMPAMSGDKLVGLFRSNDRLSTLPIVLVSAEAPERLKAICSKLTNVSAVTKKRVEQDLVPTLRACARRAEDAETG